MPVNDLNQELDVARHIGDLHRIAAAKQALKEAGVPIEPVRPRLPLKSKTRRRKSALSADTARTDGSGGKHLILGVTDVSA